MDTLIRDADPTAPSEPRFDPHGPEARAILAAALVRDVPRRRRARRLITAATVAAAAVAAAVVLALPGGISPREALAAAAERTADFDSGVIVYTSHVVAGDYRAEAEQRVRFAGADVEVHAASTEVLPDGRRLANASTYRLVDGRHYLRDEDEGSGWRRLSATGDGTPYAEQVRAAVDNRALVALVSSAVHVRRDGDRFQATVPVDRLEALPVPPSGLTGSGHEAEIDLLLDERGLIRRIGLGVAGARRTVEYRDVGTPQVISAPR